jgi:hypothetical protein
VVRHSNIIEQVHLHYGVDSKQEFGLYLLKTFDPRYVNTLILT